MGPEALAQVLRPLEMLVPVKSASSLLAGLAEGDDAAVYKLNSSQALVFTVDFFTPVVDDPYDFGAIAAANALSDVYATGGQPLLALNLAAFPTDLPMAVIQEIIRGGAEKAAEAGCAVGGGHTVTDKEPKFGLAVVGVAHPDQVLLKSGAVAGDLLVLTKPLGTGAITTAAKNGDCPHEFLSMAISSMKRLNRDALEVIRGFGVRACTDVTGFAFPGHALELAEKSKVNLRIYADKLPYLPGAVVLAAAGQLPGGAKRNRSYYEPRITFASELSEQFRALYFVPETSGGLLAAIPPDQAKACLSTLLAAGVEAAIVGRVLEKDEGPAMQVVTGTD